MGTKYTMTQDFYKNRLAARGLKILVPDAGGIETVNRVIYDELCRGVIASVSQKAYVDIIRSLRSNGAKGVILGCMEIGLLIHPEDSPLPVFDATASHATRAALAALC